MSKTIQHRNFNPDRVKQNFADVPEYYDYWAALTESRATKKVLKLANIDENESILEVGIGTGRLFEKLIQKNTAGFTAGIDLSPEMLKKARSRTAPLTVNRSFKLKQASAYDLHFGNETFDCLISCYMLDLLPEEDFTDIFNEFKHVLKPGGKLILASMTFGWKWYHHFWSWMTKTFLDLMTDCRPVDLEPFLKEAGFGIEKVESISQNTFPTQVISAFKIDK